MAFEKFEIVNDGEILVIGTSKEVSEYFGLEKTISLNNYARRGAKFLKIYDVNYHVEVDDHLIWQRNELDRSGRTIAMKDINRNVKELAEYGYIVDVKETTWEDGEKTYSLWLIRKENV